MSSASAAPSTSSSRISTAPRLPRRANHFPEQSRNRMPLSFSLADKVVLLTGGTGLFGRGLTTALAESGATLIIASRNADKLRAVAEEETARGHRVTAESYDQSDESSI